VLRAQCEHRLPTVLSREEVHRLLSCVRTPHNHAFLTTVYSCNLRLPEALHLEVSDIDSQHMLVHVHQGSRPSCASYPLGGLHRYPPG
jgi:site-specific recombinase XerD